jgi:hypothetical protein
MPLRHKPEPFHSVSSSDFGRTGGKHHLIMTSNSSDSSETRLSMLNTEAVVGQLLELCLARIGWRGEPAEWQARLNEVLDNLQTRLMSGSGRITGHQMDCLIQLCRAASACDETSVCLAASKVLNSFASLKHYSSISDLT